MACPLQRLTMTLKAWSLELGTGMYRVFPRDEAFSPSRKVVGSASVPHVTGQRQSNPIQPSTHHHTLLGLVTAQRETLVVSSSASTFREHLHATCHLQHAHTCELKVPKAHIPQWQVCLRNHPPVYLPRPTNTSATAAQTQGQHLGVRAQGAPVQAGQGTQHHGARGGRDPGGIRAFRGAHGRGEGGCDPDGRRAAGHGVRGPLPFPSHPSAGPVCPSLHRAACLTDWLAG